MSDQHPYAHPLPPPPAATSLDLRRLLGARMWRRPEPRFGTIYAGAGAALVVLGTLIWTIGYVVNGLGVDADSEDTLTVHGQARRFLGAGLFLALVAIGLVLQVWRRTGAAATAGAVLTLLGIPLTLAFVSFDVESTLRTGSYPFNVDLLFLVSILLWLAAYVAVPGARGRTVYLAAALTGLPSYIVFKAVAGSSLRSAVTTFRGDDGPGLSNLTHSGTAAAIGLLFGLAYYAVAWLLDRSGRAGVATAFVYPAFVTTVGGIVYGASDFHRGGTGVLLILIGTAVALYAGRYGRRVTAVLGSGSAMLGIVLAISEIPDLSSRYWLIGVLLILAGALVVSVAALIATTLGEPPDSIEPMPVANPVSYRPMPPQQPYPPQSPDQGWPPHL